MFSVLTRTGVDKGRGTRSTADSARGSGYLQVMVGGLSLKSDENITSQGSGWCRSNSPETEGIIHRFNNFPMQNRNELIFLRHYNHNSFIPRRKNTAQPLQRKTSSHTWLYAAIKMGTKPLPKLAQHKYRVVFNARDSLSVWHKLEQVARWTFCWWVLIRFVSVSTLGRITSRIYQTM